MHARMHVRIRVHTHRPPTFYADVPHVHAFVHARRHIRRLWHQRSQRNAKRRTGAGVAA